MPALAIVEAGQKLEKLFFPPLWFWNNPLGPNSPKIAVLDIGSGHIAGSLYFENNGSIEYINLGHQECPLGRGVMWDNPNLNRHYTTMANIIIHGIAEEAVRNGADAFTAYGTYALRTAKHTDSGRSAINQFEQTIEEVTGWRVPLAIFNGNFETDIIRLALELELRYIRGITFNPNTFFANIGRGSVHFGIMGKGPSYYFDRAFGSLSLRHSSWNDPDVARKIVEGGLEGTSWQRYRHVCTDIILSGSDWNSLGYNTARNVQGLIPSSARHVTVTSEQVQATADSVLDDPGRSPSAKLAAASLRAITDFVCIGRKTCNMHFVTADPKKAVALLAGIGSNLYQNSLA